LSDDHSRVVLEKIEEDVDSDYINASYIDVSLFILCIVTLVEISLWPIGFYYSH